MAENSIPNPRLNKKGAEGKKKNKKASEKSDDLFNKDPYLLARPIVYCINSFLTFWDSLSIVDKVLKDSLAKLLLLCLVILSRAICYIY